jgi:hypothetical protein
LTFLHTIFLAALVAAGIPILLHLLSRQRLPLIPFSSLEFLKRLQKRKSRRIQLRQLILLIIRALAVAILVLTFARPALKTSGATGSAAAVEIVAIADDGLTSAAESRDGLIYKQELERLKEILVLAGPNDRITVIRAADLQPMTVSAGSRDLILGQMQDQEPEPIVPDTRRALILADSIFRASSLFNRELYIISSFYGSEWDSIGWSQDDDRTRRILSPVGPDHLDNLAVGGVKAAGTILQRGKPVELEIVFENHTTAEARDALAGIYLDDERVAQLSVDIPAGGSATKTVTLIPTRGGLIPGRVKLEEVDALAADNRGYFILKVPDSIAVLAVAPDSADRALLNSVFAGDQTGFVKLGWGDPVGWETGSLSSCQVLLLAGVKDVSTGAATRVRQFVEAGGGVVVIPGMDSDLAGLGRGLFNELGFAGAREAVQSGGVNWSKLDLTAPIFQGIFEDKGTPKSPAFNFYLDLGVSRGDQVLIALSNGRPFLIERQVGKGRALLFAAPITPDAGDFPFTGIFAPLLFRSVIYAAAGGGNADYNWETGGNYSVVLPALRAETARLESPDGAASDLPPRPVIGGVEYRTGKIVQPGIYTIRAAGQTAGVFAANLPAGHSNLTRVGLDAAAERIGGRVIEAKGEALTQEIHAIRFGRELWRSLAAAFLLLLLSESIIGRSGRKEE